ncbi:MAG: hypothetical protein AAFV33_06380 [Chloroflexota bacterium]
MTRETMFELAMLVGLVAGVLLICTASGLSGDTKWLTGALLIGAYLSQALFRQKNPHHDHHVKF